MNHNRISFYLSQIVDEKPDPTGPFSSFSSIQAVIVTGYINTPRSDQGLISYSTDLYYHFSCRYPLQYLLNNTQITAWGTRYTYSRDMFLIAHLYSKSKSYHIFLCLFLHVFNYFSSSSVSVATSNNNGTFIDSLKMNVFNVGINYQSAHEDTNQMCF